MRSKSCKLLLIAAAASLALTGCSLEDGKTYINQMTGKEIFEVKETDKESSKDAEGNKQEEAAQTKFEIVPNQFYIMKKGELQQISKISEVSFPTDEMIVTTPNPKRVISYNSKYEKDITEIRPGDELIYITDTTVPDFNFERFYDCGYSIGLFNLTKHQAQNSNVDVNEETLLDNTHIEFTIGESKTNHLSEAYNYLSQQPLEGIDITIDAINGEKLKPEDLTLGGSIKGLKKDDVVKTDIYFGTIYKPVDLKVDTRILSSFDTCQSNEYILNKKGYASVVFPENLKSGYYLINGKALFRYVNEENSEIKSKDIDFNELQVVPELNEEK